jgi:hypothetical protein
MSRHSPTGFGFSILVEIAAVIAIVAFLPRVDLRPSSASAFTQEVIAAASQTPIADPSVAPVGWTALDIRNGEATRPTSYYERAANQTASPAPTGSFSAPVAPPFIETNRPDPKYVEDRLDRASQQLLNSVGSAATTAASNWLPAPQLQQRTSNTAQRPQIGPAKTTTTSQPRPWLRY